VARERGGGKYLLSGFALAVSAAPHMTLISRAWPACSEPTGGERLWHGDVKIDRSAVGDLGSPWWEDHDQVVAFARVLVEAGYLGSFQFAVIDYFKTPSRWSRQHAEWSAFAILIRSAKASMLSSGTSLDSHLDAHHVLIPPTVAPRSGR
jgi:hypothetical protein